jgi:streptogrisin B
MVHTGMRLATVAAPATRRPRAFLAAVALALAATPSLTVTHAGATIFSVSPGDRIQTPDVCTIAYSYTGDDGHTYAITAGHCQTSAGGHVRDEHTGATGTFIRAVVDPDPKRSGGADFGLIDFGRDSLAVPFISNRAVASGEYPRPQPGLTVCRTGASSGQHCGTVTMIHGEHQYLTTGMPDSTGGDSGGPVWTVRDDGHAQIVGIWLGSLTLSGKDYGRFAALAGAITTLDLDY